MKQCPSCKKEFPDSMRFCQTDGTPLVEVAEQAPPPDPYKTVVGGSIKMEDDLLQLPEQDDPMKTMISPMKPSAPKSEPEKPQETPKINELGKTPSASGFGEPKAPPPSANVSSNPFSGNEPPKSDPPPPPKPFNDTPKIDSGQKSSSPFDSPPPKDSGKSESPFGKPPIMPGSSPFDKPSGAPGSSPFDKPANASPSSSPFDKTPPPPYKEAEPQSAKQSSPFGGSPFDQPPPFSQSNEPMNDPFQQNEWTPPPAPVAGWQDQGLGVNTPFQPPAAGGQNNTLALVSLVLGILSFVCLGILGGIPAIILGYMQRNKIKENPAEYGGGGMAMAGMILGGISVVLTVVIFVIYAILIFANMR